jgi:hypothetical protein
MAFAAIEDEHASVYSPQETLQKLPKGNAEEMPLPESPYRRDAILSLLMTRTVQERAYCEL